MKKICFVTTIYLTYKCFLKKLSQYLYETCEYDISLICNDEPEVYEDIPEYVQFFPVKMERGISLSIGQSIKQIQSILEAEKFDIVQYSTPNAAFYTSIASKRAKVPVRLYCQWGIRYMGFKGWKRALFKRLEKITCDNSTYIEVESHNIRNFSLSEKLYSEKKSSVIWNGSASGVDLTKFDVSQKDIWSKEIRNQYNINDSDIVFAFAARLTADKGLNELLEAFINLSGKYSNIKLFVIGGMDDSHSLNSSLMEQAEKSGRVVFTGSVSDVERYYAASDVFVAPSYREGFGLVVIEAEAMALPAIVSDVPGQIDAIIPNQTGLACEVKSASSLQKQMKKMITDQELRETLGRQAQKFVEDNFEQNKLFEYLKKHRDELIGER